MAHIGVEIPEHEARATFIQLAGALAKAKELFARQQPFRAARSPLAALDNIGRWAGVLARDAQPIGRVGAEQDTFSVVKLHLERDRSQRHPAFSSSSSTGTSGHSSSALAADQERGGSSIPAGSSSTFARSAARM